MRHMVVIVWFVLFAAACSPSATPTPVPPTPDAQATETKIAFNIFATQTASAPTATQTATATSTPTLTNTPTQTATPTATNTPTATPNAKETEAQLSRNVMATLTAAAPVPTAKLGDDWNRLCSEIPPGMSGWVVTNYMGEKEIIVAVGKTKTTALPLKDTLVLLPVGSYEVSFTAPGWGKAWTWGEKIVVEGGKCRQYQIYYTLR